MPRTHVIGFEHTPLDFRSTFILAGVNSLQNELTNKANFLFCFLYLYCLSPTPT